MLPLLALSDDQRTQHAVSNVDHTIQLCRERLLAAELRDHIVTLGLVVDRISQLALAPFLNFAKSAMLADEIRKLGLERLSSLLTLGQEKTNTIS